MKSWCVLGVICLGAVSASGAFAQAPGAFTINAFAGKVRDVGDGGTATQALLWSPRGVSVDRAGDLFITDTGDGLVREVTPDGKIATVAGSTTGLFGGDGSLATQAVLTFPYRATVAPTGEIYIADAATNRVRKVSRDGRITTIAGTGEGGYSGDGGLAINAKLYSPREVVLDSRGNIYVLDTNNSRVRRISTSGVIDTYAGNGYAGYAGDNQNANQAQLNYPLGLAIDSQDNIYIADTNNNRIRIVTPDGLINTYAGSGQAGFGGDGQVAGFARFDAPQGIAIDASGNLYVADTNNHRIRKIVRGGNVATIAGTGVPGFSGDNGAATSAQLNTPRGVAADAQGNIYVADTENQRIRRITASGSISTVAGSDPAAGDGGPAIAARLFQPSGIAVDAAGNVFISDTGNHRIRRVTQGGIISTIAGTGSAGYSGDNGLATNAQFNNPEGLALDRAGNLYVADTNNHVIRRIAPGGLITTVAGAGTAGNDGDLGPATAAKLYLPASVAVDSAGQLYIADTGNNRVRRVGADGVISNFAGDPTGIHFAYNGDGQPPQGAWLNYPIGLAIDVNGDVYISDWLNNRVRKVTASGSAITTVAGNGNPGFNGDGVGTQVSVFEPKGLAIDSNHNLYVVDSRNDRIRMLQPGGTLVTIAGSGSESDSGDNGPARSASFDNPFGVAVDANGNVYITDQEDHRVRSLLLGQVLLQSISNAASLAGGSVSPGEIVTLKGLQIGPQNGVSASVTGSQIGTLAGETQVLFDGTPAPILYASATQTNVQVPYAVAGKSSTQVQIQFQGRSSAPLQIPVVDAAPGLFTFTGTGSGQAAAINEDGTLNGSAAPAARGSVIVLYATGEGQTDPSGIAGQITGSSPSKPVLPVAVRIGGALADITYAGAAPGLTAGVMQINVRVPDTAPAGSSVPVGLAVGNFSSQAGVTIAVK